MIRPETLHVLLGMVGGVALTLAVVLVIAINPFDANSPGVY